VTDMGQSGVVGVIRGRQRSGNVSKVIAMRADMDALPIAEATGLELSIRHTGQNARVRSRRSHGNVARRRPRWRRRATSPVLP
jgi:metal-dependent amidase/aminoacylase/carboxypeptidase family protein